MRQLLLLDQKLTTRVSRYHTTRNAFTLIELLIVVGIILLLAGITLRVGSAIWQQSEIRRTQAAMELLETALLEWEVESGRSLTWQSVDYGSSGSRDDFDMSDPWINFGQCEDSTDVYLISDLLEVLNRNPKSQAILAKIDSDLLFRYPDSGQPRPNWITPNSQAASELSNYGGRLVLLDAWGSPIYTTHPGVVLPSTVTPVGTVDTDGTEQTHLELKYGPAVNRRIRFVSAGPDGDFGHLSPAESACGFDSSTHDALIESTKDNLLSDVNTTN